MRKIVSFFLIGQLIGIGMAFATNEEDNEELGIVMKGAGKPTIQKAGAKAEKKLYKYNKAKKEVMAIFDPSVNKKPESEKT